ncbi:MAG: TonB-dependent receptor [Pseudomonadota bacterium]
MAFQLNPVAAGCAVFLSMMAGSVYAQDVAPATTAEAAKKNDVPETAVVVVSGIRRGIEAAISIKKNSDSIVEAISAEDIGKLPDATVAESISRLPGVTAQRDKSSGRASTISVRGLSPDFNGALLNGREQASSGDSRGVQFDLYPAEMLGSITIYKTPDASLIGQGIASTIDQRTVMPLDFGKRQVAANYKKERTGVKNDAKEGNGSRKSLTYIDQFADRTIGVALGYMKFNDSGAEQSQADGWGGWTPKLTDAGAPLYNGQNLIVPGGFKTDLQRDPKTSEGAMAILQYRPSKDFMTTLDLFNSKNTDNTHKTGLEGAICGSTGAYDPNGVLTNATISNGVATSGTCSNFKADIRNHVEAITDKLNSWGWNARLKHDGWVTTADLAGSKVTHDANRYETTAGLPGDAKVLDSISWTGFDGKNNLSPHYTTVMSYTDRNLMKLTDHAGWGGGLTGNPQAGYVAIGVTTDEVKSFRLNSKHELSIGPIAAVEVGVNRTNRDKARVQNEGNLVIPGGNPYGAAVMPGTETTITPQSGIAVASWDPAGSLGTIYNLLDKKDQPIQTDKNWAVSEKVTTFYAKGDLDGKLGELSYRGNFGAQMVHTDQSSTGNFVDTANCNGNAGKPCPATIIGGGKTYSDFLPSFNGALDLGNDNVLRLGLAKVLSRGKMSDMRPGGSVSLDGGHQGGAILVGSAGNPNLEPFRAKAVDLSFEKYFDKKGYFSVAAFYKKLDTYILNMPRVFDFASVGYKGAKPATGPNTGSSVGILTQAVNGSGGDIHGIEMSLNVPFSMVTDYLDGFGVIVNSSNTSSSVTLPTSGVTSEDTGNAPSIPLPGLSKQVTNLRLYYENHGLQLAVAMKKRSSFVGEVSDFQDNNQLTYIEGDKIIDLQASYEFKFGYLKGLSLNATVGNWTNAPFNRFNGTPDKIAEHITFGRTYSFGAGYKF